MCTWPRREGASWGEEVDEEALYGAVLRSGPANTDGEELVVMPPRANASIELERIRISREMAAIADELETETPLEMPASVKSKLNPAAKEFVPGEAPLVEPLQRSNYVNYQHYYYDQPQYDQFEASGTVYYGQNPYGYGQYPYYNQGYYHPQQYGQYQYGGYTQQQPQYGYGQHPDCQQPQQYSFKSQDTGEQKK